MIRPTITEDTEPLIRIADGTGVFKPMELVALREVLDDYHAFNRGNGHRSATWEGESGILGFVYFAPAAMTDQTWYVYWIAVAKDLQAKGIGGELLRHAEEASRAAGGRLMLIETSGLPHYDLTRRFYLRNAYQLHAVIADYYADGDDLNVFRKRLSNDPAAPVRGLGGLNSN